MRLSSEMKRAVELARERADLRDELGTILAQRNQFADAEAPFGEALRLQPNLEQAHFHLGVVHLQGQPLDEAAKELGKAVELASQDAAAHYDFAKTRTAQSRNDEALQELRKTVALKPNWYELQIE
jgi:protein O-GlcNAc transferase